MTVWIALLRGINVGGKNVVKMAELRSSLTALGFDNVQTYIQSGNVVFVSDHNARTLADQISQVMLKTFNVQANVMVLSLNDLRVIINETPIDITDIDPKTFHFWIFGARIGADAQAQALAAMQSHLADSEMVFVSDKAAYVSAPDGIGRSKLVAKMETCLEQPATARNLRTMQKVLEIAAAT